MKGRAGERAIDETGQKAGASRPVAEPRATVAVRREGRQDDRIAADEEAYRSRGASTGCDRQSGDAVRLTPCRDDARAVVRRGELVDESLRAAGQDPRRRAAVEADVPRIEIVVVVAAGVGSPHNLHDQIFRLAEHHLVADRGFQQMCVIVDPA